MDALASAILSTVLAAVFVVLNGVSTLLTKNYSRWDGLTSSF